MLKRRFTKVLSMILIGVLTTSSLLIGQHGVQAAISTLFNANFDMDGNYGNFSTSAAAPDMFTFEQVPGRADNSLKFTSQSSNSMMLYRYGSWGGTITFETKVYFEDNAHDRDIFWMHGNVNGGGTLYQTLFSYKKDGSVYFSNQKLPETYESGQWYTLKAVLDNYTGKADVWINGVQQLSGKTMLANFTVGSIRTTQYGISGTTGVMYLDDLKIIQDPQRELDQTLNGWHARAYSTGTPTFALDSAVLQGGQPTMRVTAAENSQGSLWRDFPASHGTIYQLAYTVKTNGMTKGKSAAYAIITPMKGGNPIELNGNYLSYQSVSQGTDTDFINQTLKFNVPLEADSARVELYVSGPGTVWFSTPSLTTLPVWQELIGKYSSADVHHPVSNPANMFGWGAWTGIANESLEQLKANVKPLMEMSEEQFITAARADGMKRTSVDTHAAYESMARRMADVYKKTEEADYARRAIIILQEMAAGYPNVPAKNSEAFFFPGGVIPTDAVYTYDLLYSSSEWAQLSTQYGTDVRANVENWFRSAAMNLIHLYQPGPGNYSNIAPYGVKGLMGTAAVLNDPDLIRLVIPWTDSIVTSLELYADGFWSEATVSYHDQVIGLINGAFNMLKDNFEDPAGYQDVVYGLHLSGDTLRGRYPMMEKALGINAVMKLPDGAPIAINDTWNNDPASKSANDPIVTNYVKNVELYDYGNYAITRGDTQEATMADLNFEQIAVSSPYWNGGHQHGSHLNLVLWGSGMEVFPDAGYANTPAANRYFHMSAPAHNIPWVWSRNAQYGTTTGSARTSLLAYDPGVSSGKQIQVLEASQPGPVADDVEMKRRLLMMVQTEGNRSYVLDLSRLKGGDAHQEFLRASEDEDTEFSSSLQLTPHTGTLTDYFQSIGHEEGMADFRSVFTNPRTGDGSQDFSFTWTGDTSGTSVTSYINGVPGDEIIFSTIPTMRRTYNKPEQKDAFPGDHFQRRRLVNSNEVTRYGAVYETARANQTGLIQDVEWKQTSDNDPMTQVAVVDMGDLKDIVYISDDTVVREVEGFMFAGKVAYVRVNKATGDIVKAYVYGEGSIGSSTGFHVEGKSDIQLKMTQTTSRYAGDAENTIQVNGSLPQDGSLNGVWLRTLNADQSGWGMRIDGVQGNTIQVHDYPPFKIVASGVEPSFYPHRAIIPGDAYVIIQQPTFIQDITAPITTTDYTDSSWKNTLQTVNLTASDDLSGVAVTKYRLDGGPYMEGSTIEITEEGTYQLEYFSQDKAGNAETPKSIEVNIDYSIPIIGVSMLSATDSVYQAVYASDEVSIHVSVSDPLSGVKEFAVTLDGAAVNQPIVFNPYSLSPGNHWIEITATDVAGNTTVQTFVFRILGNSQISKIKLMGEKHYKNKKKYN